MTAVVSVVVRSEAGLTGRVAGGAHCDADAMEAVKQGSAAVGLKSKDFVVLATLKRAASELSSYQRKLFKIDDHMAIAIAGLTADGRVLSRYMRSECINHQFVYETPMNVGRLVTQVTASSPQPLPLPLVSDAAPCPQADAAASSLRPLSRLLVA
jgi:hypothetical protein